MKKFRRQAFAAIVCMILCNFVYAQETWEEAEALVITPADLRIDVDTMGGYHLRIRKKPGIASVMLTESTESLTRLPTTFAYRSPAYNSINGGEGRILDGALLRDGRHYLVDSTPEPDDQFGQAFHIFIPYVLEYGYPWSRQGEVQVLDGTFMSVRAFTKPYADYAGEFLDNPFVMRIIQRPLAGPPEGNFMPDTVKTYTNIADEGDSIKSPGKEDMINSIARFMDKQKGPALDFVLALDTTQSMRDDIPYLRELLVPMIREHVSRFESFRVGLVLYRDYNEEYLNRVIPFTTDLEQLQKNINAARVAGGRDIPEAVYEALDAAIRGYDWQADNRIIVLVGDAPPHPRPRGKVTEETVKNAAKEKDITLYTIILPQ
ncbi:MAG: VWA domain-containing protein [Spirochaetales bacterium]|nr:VWA domain-containing protein [Spirochaetales bacterium]